MRAFTLIEMLLAVAICAIVLVAINGVFATAVRLRDKTSESVEESPAAEPGAGHHVSRPEGHGGAGRVPGGGLQVRRAGGGLDHGPERRGRQRRAWISSPPRALSATRPPGATCRKSSMS